MIFREKGRKGEKQGEKHTCERETPIHCLSHTPQLRTKPCNLGTCPDQELNHNLLVFEMMLPPTEPHWPGQSRTFWMSYKSGGRTILPESGLYNVYILVFPLLCQPSCLMVGLWGSELRSEQTEGAWSQHTHLSIGRMQGHVAVSHQLAG